MGFICVEVSSMKKYIKFLAPLLALIVFAVSMHGCMLAPKDWYIMTLRYYQDGYASGWANERPDIKVYDVLKRRPSKSGYLLTDLDGDGDEELLIGFTDIAGATRFTDVFVWNREDGAYHALSKNEGCYIYLCADNILRVDFSNGVTTTSRFLRFDHKSNSFKEIEGEYAPMMIDLHSFWG